MFCPAVKVVIVWGFGETTSIQFDIRFAPDMMTVLWLCYIRYGSGGGYVRFVTFKITLHLVIKQCIEVIISRSCHRGCVIGTQPDANLFT